jgi:hypothetical protein
MLFRRIAITRKFIGMVLRRIGVTRKIIGSDGYQSLMQVFHRTGVDLPAAEEVGLLLIGVLVIFCSSLQVPEAEEEYKFKNYTCRG